MSANSPSLPSPVTTHERLDVESLKGEFGQEPLFPDFDLEALEQGKLAMLSDETGESNHEEHVEELAPEPQRKASLRDILEKARKAEDDFDDVEIDLEELGKDLRGKVDNIVDYIDQCEARAKQLKKRAKELEAKAKALENKSKNLKSHIAHLMVFDTSLRGIKDDKPRLSGNHFEIALRYSEKVETKDANAALFMRFGKTLIRRYYEWDKKALKSVLKSSEAEGNPDVSEFASIKREPQIQIKPKG